MEIEQQTSINKLIADEKELTRQGVVLDFVKSKVDTLDRKFDNLLDKMDGKYASKEELRNANILSEDHESRIRSIETKVWRAIGALTILQVIVLPAVFYLLFKH